MILGMKQMTNKKLIEREELAIQINNSSGENQMWQGNNDKTMTVERAGNRKIEWVITAQTEVGGRATKCVGEFGGRMKELFWGEQKTTVISERAGWGCRRGVAPGGVGSITLLGSNTIE
jgi:hypothetical protein